MAAELLTVIPKEAGIRPLDILLPSRPNLGDYGEVMTTGALEGIKVLDLTRLLPGPFCTTILADHGADVVVVEAPRFKDDPVLAEAPMLRRNKRHMALDLKSDEGKQIFFKLASAADVFIEGFRPGVADRLGVGYQTLRAANRRIVYCSLTGYGQTGPLAKKAGHDLNYMAFSGMLDLVRNHDGRPIAPNFQMADLSGSLYAVVGILLAIVSRGTSGEGQYVDVSMTDGLISLLPLPLSFAFSGNSLPGRADVQGREWFPCYDLYRTRDGEHLSIGSLEPHLWAALCRRLGFPDYADLQYDLAAREEMGANLRTLFARRDLADWLEILNSDDDCVAPVRKVTELPKDPHLLAREMILNSNGDVPAPGIAPKLLGTPGTVRRPPYSFGGDTKEVLRELGHSEQGIADLESKGVVWSPVRQG